MKGTSWTLLWFHNSLCVSVFETFNFIPAFLAEAESFSRIVPGWKWDLNKTLGLLQSISSKGPNVFSRQTLPHQYSRCLPTPPWPTFLEPLLCARCWARYLHKPCITELSPPHEVTPSLPILQRACRPCVDQDYTPSLLNPSLLPLLLWVKVTGISNELAFVIHFFPFFVLHLPDGSIFLLWTDNKILSLIYSFIHSLIPLTNVFKNMYYV